MWIIVYSHERSGWVLYDLQTSEVLSGPHDSHADAEQAARTRAYRLAQGWAP